MFTIFLISALLISLNGGVEGSAFENCKKDGYMLHGTGCYKLHDKGVTWEVAKTTCESEGGYLAIINDDLEAMIVNAITKDSSFSYDWIGLHDETGNDTWKSVHGDSIDNLYHVWADTKSRKYKCGAMKFTAEIDNLPCTNEYSFVCEKNVSE